MIKDDMMSPAPCLGGLWPQPPPPPTARVREELAVDRRWDQKFVLLFNIRPVMGKS